MSAFTFRPAKRENTPLVIGIAGPTKSGKTYSALRLATGLAGGGTIAMLNAEGARGHQYADRYKYVAAEIDPPYRYDRYTEALVEVAKINPAVLIVDSVSHAHDGPGGHLEWHEAELDRMVGDDYKRREKATFAGWVKPQAAQNAFVYALQEVAFPILFCMRAKEKIKIVPGKPVIDLGWQPIVGERVAFETIFTLMLPPHSKGVPDLSISDMREPFDTMIPAGRQIDEKLGEQLAAWARGGTTQQPAAKPAEQQTPDLAEQAELIARDGVRALETWWAGSTNEQRVALKSHLPMLKTIAESADQARDDWSEAGGEK